jgi:2,4-dichlorophenol 6-monooxygenase
MIETDVFIVGSGPAGSTAALALSTYGISNVLVTKHRWLADTPRAHVTNQRTFEILRDLGVEAEARAFAVPEEEIKNIVFCSSLAGEEWARMLPGPCFASIHMGRRSPEVRRARGRSHRQQSVRRD